MNSVTLGLTGLGFWLALALIVIAIIWAAVRKQQMKHELTLKLLERGQGLDPELLAKVLASGVNSATEQRRDDGAMADAYATASDELLVLLARDRNQRAFAVLVERHQEWRRNLLRRLSSDRALADDLAQQVLLQAWDALPNLRAGQALPAWLKTIAVHTWLKHLRRKDPLFILTRDATVPEQSVENTSGMRLDLNRALGQLVQAVRLCVVLAYHEGLSHSAIAQITGLPLGTVKSHIGRGSAQLRAYLAAYDTRRLSP